MSLEVLLARLPEGLLSDDDARALAATIAGTRDYDRGQAFVRAGVRPKNLHLISEGWAACTLMLEDGSRQITQFYLTGDLCDLSSLGNGVTEAVTALCPVRVTLFDRQGLLALLSERHAVAILFLRLALAEQAILRTALARMGLQEAREQTAHLFCELQYRLRRVGLVGDHDFTVPLTQDDLGDAMGKTPTHMNRVLQSLRREGLITFDRHRLRILAPDKLHEIAEFDWAYLKI